MIARGGAGFVFAPLVAMVLVGAATILLENWQIVQWSLPLGILFVFFLVFFRDPERAPGAGIVSPADGRVLSVDPNRNTLVVFMGLASVHVNRAPFEGRVVQMAHREGRHAAANTDKAGENERLETVLDTPVGRMTIAQVAGFLARRIVPYVRPRDRVAKAQRIGMIRFGSRVELTLPPGARFVVRPGDKVRAGETTVAEVEGYA